MPLRWQVASEGGYLANPRLSRQLRYAAQPLLRFRQHVRVEPGFGKNKGDRIEFLRVSNVANPGRALAETEVIPETTVTISKGSVIVQEYGNAVTWTGKLEALAEFDPENPILRVLRDDSAKVLDAEAKAAFAATKLYYTPTGTSSAPTATWSTTGAATAAATRNVSAFDVKEIVDALKGDYLAPLYDGENYLCIASVGFTRGLKDSTDWADAAKFGDPERLFSGEVGRFYGVRFVEATGSMSNRLGTTNYKGEAIFFGADAVVEGVVVPVEIRAKVPTDYGRDKGIAWYFLGGWAIVFDTANAGEARIVRVWST